MSDFQITNGTVVYSRMIRPADFENKTSSVTLSFAIADGADPAAVTAKVSSIAREQVHAELGLPHNRGLKPEDRPQVVAPPPAEPEPEKTTRTRKPKAEAPKEVPEVNPLEELAGDAPRQEPASGEPDASDVDDLEALAGPEPTPATIEDVKVMLMKVSAHLRKKFGHVNDINKLLASFNVPGYKSLKPEQMSKFIEAAKGLLEL